MSRTSALDVFSSGLVATGEPGLPTGELPAALRSFVQQPLAYRQAHLQQHYGVAFDGYSYQGQTDSLNQGPDDQLHSFVLSDFSPAQRFPAELQPFLQQRWRTICEFVAALEQRYLLRAGLTAIAEQRVQHFGHMLSANYYPPIPAQAAQPPLRLTEHPDVSLLTVFPFGMPAGFQYQGADGGWRDAPATDQVVLFPGHLLEWMSDGAVPALNHRVKPAAPGAPERFSFALFSLPAPGALLKSNAGAEFDAEGYFRWHLSQWD